MHHSAKHKRNPEEQTTSERPRAVRSMLQKIKESAPVKAMGSLPWKSLVRFVVRLIRRRLLPVGCFLLCLVVLISGMALAISGAVYDKTEDRIRTAEELVAMEADFDYILILGCGVYADGTMTPMLSDRVQTGVSLYLAGLHTRMLMSGDHRDDSYNEVDPMKEAAIEQGVPADQIDTDPYGLSTYDSIYRLAQLYKGKRVVIVTQEYHLPRALYIAEKLGVEAYGLRADLRPYRGQIKYDAREVLARCKDVFYAQVRPNSEH